MHHNTIQFRSLTAKVFAEKTKSTDDAFACYIQGKNTSLVRENSFHLIETTGECNGKEFTVLAGHSIVTGLTKFALFTSKDITLKEKKSIQAKIMRILRLFRYTVDSSTSFDLVDIHFNNRQIELCKHNKISAKVLSPELFYLLNVSQHNVSKAINLGAIFNSQLRRYMISTHNVNFTDPNVVAWLPENNPGFKLDNPKYLMRLNQFFKENGAVCVHSISSSGKVRTADWMIYADHPAFDDFRIHILGNQFRIYLNVSKQDSLKVRELGAIWDKRCAKFYVADIEENYQIFNKWLSSNNPELMVYISDTQFNDVKDYDLFSTENSLYRRIFADNPKIKEIMQCQELSILEQETLKKELIMLHVGKSDANIVRKLGAVQRVIRRLEWFVSTDHPNYLKLSQWLPENNPQCFMDINDYSVAECKEMGCLYDTHAKKWFLYNKEYQEFLKKVA